MKTTVRFEGIHVVVPCHEGDLSIRDLVNKAIVRYKKLTCKPPEHWVKVHRLRLSRDNGILDWDDQVSDVLDDRELLVAEFSEQACSGPPSSHNNNGDGASGSSVGTASPEIIQVVQGSANHVVRENDTDVLVTRYDLTKAGSSLIVRGGAPPTSAPVIPATTTSTIITATLGNSKENKVPGSGSIGSVYSQSNIVVNPRQQAQIPPVLSSTPVSSPLRNGVTTQPLATEGKPRPDFFNRNSARRSLGNNPALIRWLEAQDNLEQHRTDPVGASATSPGGGGPNGDIHHPQQHRKLDTMQQLSITVRLAANKGHGIHLGHWMDPVTRELRGIEILKVEEGGSFAEDGQIHSGDNISEVNNISLRGLSFKDAHSVFIQATLKSEARLQVFRPYPYYKSSKQRNQHAHTAPSSPTATTSAFKPVGSRHAHPNPTIYSSQSPSSPPDDVASPLGSPGEKPRPPPRSASTKLSGLNTSRDLNQMNVRTLGQKITIVLTKPTDGGLGFTLTSRDNPTGGPNPIYVKTILPKGAAILDGRLTVGDRLLRVDDQDTTQAGINHRVVAEMLRSVDVGSSVTLVVSRQAAAEEVPSGVEKSPAIVPRHEDELTFKIAVSTSGLGINVKWRCDSGLVPGVYIDSIVPGRAAHADNRLEPNDRILCVDDTHLAPDDSRLATQQLRAAIVAAKTSISIKVARAGHVVHHPIPMKPDVLPRPLSTTGPDTIPVSRTSVDSVSAFVKETRRFTSMEYLHSKEDDSDDNSESRAARFNREGPGRQSMSEKRHAHVDAKELKFYQEEFLQARQRKEDMGRPYATLPSASRMRQIQKGGEASANRRQDGQSIPVVAGRHVRQLPATPVSGGMSRQPPPNYNSSKHDVDVTASELAQPPSKLHCREVASSPATTGIHSTYIPPAMALLTHAVSVESILSNNVTGYNGNHNPMRSADSMNNLHQRNNQSSGFPDETSSPRIKRGGAANSSFRRAVDRSYQATFDPSEQSAVSSSSHPHHHHQGHHQRHHSHHNMLQVSQAPVQQEHLHHVELSSLEADSKKAAKKSALANFKDMFKLGKSSSRKSSLGSRSANTEPTTSLYLQTDHQPQTQQALPHQTDGRHSSSAERVRIWQQQHALEVQGQRSVYEPLGVGHHAPLRPNVGNADRMKQVQHLRGKIEPNYNSSDGGSYLQGNRRAKSLHLEDDPGYQNLDSLVVSGNSKASRPAPPLPPPIPLCQPNQYSSHQQTQSQRSQVLPNRPTAVKHYTVGEENTVYALISKPTKKGIHVS